MARRVANLCTSLMTNICVALVDQPQGQFPHLRKVVAGVGHPDGRVAQPLDCLVDAVDVLLPLRLRAPRNPLRSPRRAREALPLGRLVHGFNLHRASPPVRATRTSATRTSGLKTSGLCYCKDLGLVLRRGSRPCIPVRGPVDVVHARATASGLVSSKRRMVSPPSPASAASRACHHTRICHNTHTHTHTHTRLVLNGSSDAGEGCSGGGGGWCGAPGRS